MGTGTDKPVVLLGERRRARASGPSSMPRANTVRELCRTVDRGEVGCHRMLQQATRSSSARHGPRCPRHGFALLSTVMFSTIIRRATPSLRQARSYTAAANTQAAASSSSERDKGEQAIYDKLSEHFQTSELLVQDVSGTHHSHPLRNALGEGV